MIEKITMFILGLLIIQSSILAESAELNLSYDYFRGLPDGSWNGNSGLLMSLNMGRNVYDDISLQLGGSYGNYNWDGRQNQVFENTKSTQQIGFFTGGLSYTYHQFNAGIVYDYMCSKHFGIYNLSPSIDQIRFQAGYETCSEEYGFWGTSYLTKCSRRALGVPIKFRTIDQINLFWTHKFDNCSKTSLWIGLLYSHSLRYSDKSAGQFTAGFSVKAPLTESLFLEGNGSYMRARNASGYISSRNYAASVSVGITYAFSLGCLTSNEPYLPVANHSNFLVDTNITQ